MHLIYRRYSRSGYAPALFYLLMALGFGALAVYSAVRGSWLVMAIALAMIGVTIGGSRMMSRLKHAADAPRRTTDDEMEVRDGR